VSLVQCSINDLNGVTEKDQIKYKLRKCGSFKTFGKDEDYFKHYVKMKIIHNPHYENEEKKKYLSLISTLKRCLISILWRIYCFG